MRFYRRLVIICLLPQITVFASAAEYHLNRDQNRSVKFVSEAPIEDFEGITDKIDGYVLWAGGDLGDQSDFENSEFYFEVELAGLDTGIGLRNRHMRNNYLETDQFPYASYTGKIINVKPDSTGFYTVTSQGQFRLHGIERDISIVVRVSQFDDNLEVYSEFAVKLTDYDIKIPSLMFLKINENIQIFLKFSLKNIE